MKLNENYNYIFSSFTLVEDTQNLLCFCSLILIPIFSFTNLFKEIQMQFEILQSTSMCSIDSSCFSQNVHLLLIPRPILKINEFVVKMRFIILYWNQQMFLSKALWKGNKQ